MILFGVVVGTVSSIMNNIVTKIVQEHEILNVLDKPKEVATMKGIHYNLVKPYVYGGNGRKSTSNFAITRYKGGI